MDIIKRGARYSLPALIGYFAVFRTAAGIFQLTGAANPIVTVVLAVITGCAAVFAESTWHFTKSLKDKAIIPIVILSAVFSPILKIADKYITGASCDLISAWGFGCVLCVFFMALWRTAGHFFRRLKKDSLTKNETALMIGAWVLTTAVTVFCAFKSSAVYTYDFAIYHERAALYINLLKSDPAALCGRLYTSFGTDYSGLPSLFAMPFMLLLGNSRAVYVLSLSIYSLAAYFILFVTVKKLSPAPMKNFIILILEFPLMTFLTLKGFPDVGCTAIGAAAIYIYLFSEEKGYADGFFSGVLLACGFLFRRYFMMFVIGFGAAVIIDCLPKKKNRFIFPFFCLLGMGGTMLLPFQKLMVKNLLMRNYGDAYSYYQMGAAVNIEFLIKAFGGLLILGLLIGFIILRKDRNAVFCAVGLAVTLTAFLLTQSPGKHHMSIFMTWALIIMITVNGFVLSKVKKASAVLLTAAVIQSAVCFVPGEKFPLFHNMLIKPDIESSENLESYKTVSDFLTANLKENEKAYVLGVSDKFSESKLEAVNFSLTGELKAPALLTAAIVDSRDRLPEEFFDVKYIVVTDPIQYERGEEYQQVVKIPAQMLLSSEGWGQAFERLDITCTLDDGTKVYIYERIRDVTPEERRSLSFLM